MGLILSHLPRTYMTGLHWRLEAALASPALSPTQVFDFSEVHSLKTAPSLAYLLAVSHATWHHR